MLSKIFKHCIKDIRGGNKVSKEEVKEVFLTLPNLITTSGIFLTVLYIFQFCFGFCTWLIPVNIALVALSDLVDGCVASCKNQHSWLGKFLDKLRDKLILTAILLNFFHENHSFGSFALIVLLITAEMWVAYLDYMKKFIKKTKRYHATEKTRQAAYIACGLIFAVQQYWTESVAISNDLLLAIMLLASYFLLAKSRKSSS